MCSVTHSFGSVRWHLQMLHRVRHERLLRLKIGTRIRTWKGSSHFRLRLVKNRKSVRVTVNNFLSLKGPVKQSSAELFVLWCGIHCIISMLSISFKLASALSGNFFLATRARDASMLARDWIQSIFTPNASTLSFRAFTHLLEHFVVHIDEDDVQLRVRWHLKRVKGWSIDNLYGNSTWAMPAPMSPAPMMVTFLMGAREEEEVERARARGVETFEESIWESSIEMRRRDTCEDGKKGENTWWFGEIGRNYQWNYLW